MTNQLQEYPTSVRLVYKVLEYEDDTLTQSEIADRADSPESTVRQALYTLEDAGLVEKQTVYRDTRRNVYHAVKC